MTLAVPHAKLLREQHTVELIEAHAWSRDGHHLVTATKAGSVVTWGLTSGEVVTRELPWSGTPVAIDLAPVIGQIALSSTDGSIRIFQPPSATPLRNYLDKAKHTTRLSWSPDGLTLATAMTNSEIVLRHPASRRESPTPLAGHTSGILYLAWSPDGRSLASASDDHSCIVWSPSSHGGAARRLSGHFDSVRGLVWSPGGKTLISCSADSTIRVWNAKNGRMVAVLEGHTAPVEVVSLSHDGRLLASLSRDNSVKFWRCDTWDAIGSLKGKNERFLSLSFHPHEPVLRILLQHQSTKAQQWGIDIASMTTSAPAAVHYSNAKVVLVGDSGVGKSGLALVLSGHDFSPTESTHARHVWTFEKTEVAVDKKPVESRETFLWDLAGQPGYRLVHQLHLAEVQVALVLIDARSETDPFAGALHWGRALAQAEKMSSQPGSKLVKFLVAARMDRGGLGVSKDRIGVELERLGFDGFFRTSAKEMAGIDALKKAIRRGIRWETLPKVTSTALFRDIKAFLVAEKVAGRLMSTQNDLYYSFARCHPPASESADLRSQFDTCVRLVESRDLIRRLSFGNIVLLQPELLDAYASSIIEAAKDEPDGLGCIAERHILEGRFQMPAEARIGDPEQERLVLIATVELLLRHEVALREPSNEETYLVFPSQLTRKYPELDEPAGKEVTLAFQGPVWNIYATLIVRLSHSGIFGRKAMWKNAVIFVGIGGGECGVFVSEQEEASARFTLFFSESTSEDVRLQFEHYVLVHLRRHALDGSVDRQRIYSCGDCGTPLSALQVRRRLERQAEKRKRARERRDAKEFGDWLECPVCDSIVMLRDRGSHLLYDRSTTIPEIDRPADARRELGVAAAVLEGKVATEQYDVFLSYNSQDGDAVERVAQELRRRGLRPWLDRWAMRPGDQWREKLESAIERIDVAAVFIGAAGLGPWQSIEHDALFVEATRRGRTVVPVILPNCSSSLRLPLFLRTRSVVDLRDGWEAGVERLVLGVRQRSSVI